MMKEASMVNEPHRQIPVWKVVRLPAAMTLAGWGAMCIWGFNAATALMVLGGAFQTTLFATSSMWQNAGGPNEDLPRGVARSFIDYTAIGFAALVFAAFTSVPLGEQHASLRHAIGPAVAAAVAAAAWYAHTKPIRELRAGAE